ncbi:MAG TPA: c-type cytochrome biogenesis protein CcmI [Microvirga sp.]|nr:c-type cytochrome biogenesis protein CcmI [Microvirga sp.]
MVIWIILLLMTAAAVMAVLWPLSRHRPLAMQQADPDMQFYREQLAEIERDRERGVLLPGEAEAAKAEAGRRLLRATGMTAADAFTALGEPALRRRRAASTLALSVIPIMALALYGAYGSPQLLTHPPEKQAQKSGDKLDLMAAVAQIEAHLAQNPQDGRGWEVVAPVYMRMGRIEEAVKAYDSAIRYLGPSAERLANFGEAMVLAKDGLVSAEAQAVFERAAQMDKTAFKARYYLAVAAEQDGKTGAAKQAYADILATSPEGAPWISAVRQRLASLGEQPVAWQGDAPQIEAADIARMVSGLAERLETQGGSPDEWARLIRSYAVLGQRDKAAAAAQRARQALAQDHAGLNTIDAMTRELKLTDAQP